MKFGKERKVWWVSALDVGFMVLIVVSLLFVLWAGGVLG